MRPIKKNLIGKLLTGCLIIFYIALVANARILYNGSGDGYPGEKDSSDPTIENYVSEGAGYFLSGYSDIQKFLELYELQDKNGINYEDWTKIVNRAIYNFDQAANTYELLIKKASSTTYNEDFISRLMSFNYSDFAKENGLNSIIFQECEAYLKRGDITGIYKYTYTVVMDVLSILRSVKYDLSLNSIPILSNLWILNETCARLSLFGQYASRVFYAVSKI